MVGIYFIFAAVLIIALWGLIVAYREDRLEAKKEQEKEDKLEKIERVLKVYAQKNQDMAEAIKKAGFNLFGE
ncbi:MAG: hypothetical protein AB1325_13470 [Nitrospirota bacterium]